MIEVRERHGTTLPSRPERPAGARLVGRYGSGVDGYDDTTLGDESRLMAFDEFNDLIGVEAKYKLAERYGVK